MPATKGLISFVGAGPGAVDLLTLRAAARLKEAQIVIYPSSLVSEEVLSLCPQAEVIDSAPLTLEEICAVFGENPEARIVRLASGDPTIYGALTEQIQWCIENGRSFEIVPGVSSLTAAAAVLERELTVPGVSQSVVITRYARRTAKSMGRGEGIAAFAATGATMALFLSGAYPRQVAAELLSPPSAFRPETPVAIVYRATWPEQTVKISTIKELEKDMRSFPQKRSILLLVGDFLSASPARSMLYCPEFSHMFRKSRIRRS